MPVLKNKLTILFEALIHIKSATEAVVIHPGLSEVWRIYSWIESEHLQLIGNLIYLIRTA